MTAPALAPVRTVPARTTSPDRRPLLSLVPDVRRRLRGTGARTPFAVVLVGLLGAGLLGLLALNTVLAEGSFRLHALQAEAKELATREQVLQREVEVLRAPGSLEDRARALGMVPGGPPVYLRLSDGAVLGTPVAGVAPAPAAPGPGTAGAGSATSPAAGAVAPQGSTTWTGPRPSAAPTTAQSTAQSTTRSAAPARTAPRATTKPSSSARPTQGETTR